MKRRSFFTALFSLVAALSFGAGLAFLGAPKPELPIGHNAGAVPVEEAQGGYEYILKAYKGRLAVFLRGATDPDLVFDVPIGSLPEYDRHQLKNGVAAKDYAQLVSLIEDYTS